MRGPIVGLVFAGALFAITDVVAQPTAPSVECVTVNGQSVPDQEIQTFVQSRVVLTFRLGKVARWKKGICPTVMGLKSDLTEFVAKRMRDTAVRVGAPVNRDAHCEPDIQIVFTTTAQALLDDIRKHYDALLGYHETDSQAEEMAKVTHPIHAWYSTVTLDLKGTPNFDGAKIDNNACLDFPKCRLHGTADAVTGLRIHDGLRSTFHDVNIVIHPEKLREYPVMW